METRSSSSALAVGSKTDTSAGGDENPGSLLRYFIRSVASRPIVLLMTAFPAGDLPDLGSQVQAIVQKPFDVLALAELVRDCVESRRHYEDRIVSDLDGIGAGHPASANEPSDEN